MYELKLFITSDTNRNNADIVDVLNQIFGDNSKEKYSLEIINVLKDPEKAFQYNVIATPTLQRVEPKPEKRLIGDLTDPGKVRIIIDVVEGN